jgi:predicted small lipoprotein YifL
MMRFALYVGSVALVVASLLVLPGCGTKQPAGAPAQKPATEHFEGDGHDHSKDGHKDHDHEGHEHEKEGHQEKK